MKLAGVEYVGLPGISRDCLEAVMRMLQFNDDVRSARILTNDGSHCLLLTVGEHDRVVVKSGFGSGYVGEGSRTFAIALQLLRSHAVALSEVDVSQGVLARADASALTAKDVDAIESAPTVRPIRWADYIHEMDMWDKGVGELWGYFRPVIPYAIIDLRLSDLALTFREHPNDSLLQGFRRLEDLVRKRIESKESGTKLFSQAFQGDKSKLTWSHLESGEHAGRANLFAGAYMAYRNPRAHRELDTDVRAMLSEFLILNELYRLEAAAVERPTEESKLNAEP